MRRTIQGIARHLNNGSWQAWVFMGWVLVVYIFFFLQFLSYSTEIKLYFSSFLSALG